MKHSGEFVRQEIACFPSTVSGTTTNSNECFSSVIIPANKIHISVGVSPVPGAIIALHAVPLQYPLAMTYIEVLTSLHTYGFDYGPSNEDSKGSIQNVREYLQYRWNMYGV